MLNILMQCDRVYDVYLLSGWDDLLLKVRTHSVKLSNAHKKYTMDKSLDKCIIIFPTRTSHNYKGFGIGNFNDMKF